MPFGPPILILLVLPILRMIVTKMQLNVDDDLLVVAEFMQTNLPASKLIAVASSLYELPPLP